MAAQRREPLAREFPVELQVAATNGSILTDSRGRKHIDFVTREAWTSWRARSECASVSSLIASTAHVTEETARLGETCAAGDALLSI